MWWTPFVAFILLFNLPQMRLQFLELLMLCTNMHHLCYCPTYNLCIDRNLNLVPLGSNTVKQIVLYGVR